MEDQAEQAQYCFEATLLNPQRSLGSWGFKDLHDLLYKC